MKIYTKTGDRGKTSLYGGKRVPKYDLQVNAAGAVDEVTSSIGWVIAANMRKKDEALLTKVQNDLYKIMAVIAGNTHIDLGSLSSDVLLIERRIDEIDKKLPALGNFILPQGGESASRCHVARTLVRRSERAIWLLFSHKKHATVVRKKNREMIAQYINRLSDLLFVLARYYSKKEIAAKI